jgi:putative membrane protein
LLLMLVSRLEEIAMKYLPIASLLLLPLCASAAGGPDATFYKHAAEGGISEVQLGNLALQKSEDPAVKEFAAQMVKDHSVVNGNLRFVAASQNVTLPTKASVSEMATKAKLEVLSGSTFDKSYIKAMVKDHEKDVAEFSKEVSSGQDAYAKAFAAATLPTLTAHLQKVRAIADKSGISE